MQSLNAFTTNVQGLSLASLCTTMPQLILSVGCSFRCPHKSLHGHVTFSALVQAWHNILSSVHTRHCDQHAACLRSNLGATGVTMALRGVRSLRGFRNVRRVQPRPPPVMSRRTTSPGSYSACMNTPSACQIARPNQIILVALALAACLTPPLLLRPLGSSLQPSQLTRGSTRRGMP